MSRDRTPFRNRLLGAAALAVLATPFAGASPAAAAGCPLSTKEQQSYPGNGGYYSRLTATGISCAGAKDVMRGHYKCRTRRGGSDGKCPRFSGWRCTETRKSGAATYRGSVTCRKSGRKVFYIYTEGSGS